MLVVLLDTVQMLLVLLDLVQMLVVLLDTVQMLVVLLDTVQMLVVLLDTVQMLAVLLDTVKMLVVLLDTVKMLVVFRCKDRTFRTKAVNVNVLTTNTPHTCTQVLLRTVCLCSRRWGRKWPRQFGYMVRIEKKSLGNFFMKVPNIKCNL
jgi:hypothetical protein